MNSEILARTDVLSIRSLNLHLASMQHHATNYYLMYRDTLGLSSSQCEQAEADKHVFRSDMKYSLAPSCGRYRFVQSFRSTTWSNLQVAGWTGSKMQRDSLINNCPLILAASSSLSTTAVPPRWLKNLKAGRRIIAWSGPTMNLWSAVYLPILLFRATLSLDLF